MFFLYFFICFKTLKKCISTMLGFHHRWPKRPRERKTHSLGSSALSRTLTNLMTQILSTPLSSGSLSSTCELSLIFFALSCLCFSFSSLINLFSILGLSFFSQFDSKFWVFWDFSVSFRFWVCFVFSLSEFMLKICLVLILSLEFGYAFCLH